METRYRCKSCGHVMEERYTARDPYGSDEILSYCPECGAVEEISEIKEQSTDGN